MSSVERPFQHGLMWFRRDLRTQDNAALFHALKQSARVSAVFVFDKAILDALPNKADRRVEFIWHTIAQLQTSLRERGGDLIVLHDHAQEAIPRLAKSLGVDAVFTNRDYEPDAVARDNAVEQALLGQNISFFTFKDQVIFEKDEVMTQAGKPFSVFTPFKNAWLKKLNDFYLSSYPVDRYASALKPAEAPTHIPGLAQMGFEVTNLSQLPLKPGATGAQEAFDDFVDRMDQYKQARDFPAIKGVSYLSVHMRFGTISIRQAAKKAWDIYQAHGSEGAMSWLNELIWRDFYFHVLHFNPRVTQESFRPEYDAIAWETGDTEQSLFKAWCEGKTGYPLVDAAMRQLNTTGYMHNRLRMVAACFLMKDLGINWRRGEAYFAELLNDFDLSANNGGWQWASSSGCDAQPYFRIFNPVSQSEKFDPEGRFIRRYCPELAQLSNKHIHAPWEAPPMELSMAGVVLGNTYPQPVVQHDVARKRTLERYAVVKKAVATTTSNTPD